MARVENENRSEEDGDADAVHDDGYRSPCDVNEMPTFVARHSEISNKVALAIDRVGAVEDGGG